MKITATALVLLALGSPALAAPAISCHCFRDRSFDPRAPAAADPYVLATAGNSLLAAAFGVRKGEVVRAKMAGTRGADLWVAHYLAEETGRSVEELLESRADAPSWARVYRSRRLAATGGPGAALARGAPDGEVASAVVDRVLVARLGADPRAVEQVRTSGASDAETIASIVGGGLADGDPAEIFGRVTKGPATWGSFFHGIGVAPEDLGDRVEGLVRRGDGGP